MYHLVYLKCRSCYRSVVNSATTLHIRRLVVSLIQIGHHNIRQLTTTISILGTPSLCDIYIFILQQCHLPNSFSLSIQCTNY